MKTYIKIYIFTKNLDFLKHQICHYSLYASKARLKCKKKNIFLFNSINAGAPNSMDSYQYDEAEYDDYDSDYGDQVTKTTRLYILS